MHRLREVLGFRSGVPEHSVLLGYDTASICNQFSAFQRKVVPSSLKFKSSRNDCTLCAAG
jgi:hypothetical protein